MKVGGQAGGVEEPEVAAQAVEFDGVGGVAQARQREGGDVPAKRGGDFRRKRVEAGEHVGARVVLIAAPVFDGFGAVMPPRRVRLGVVVRRDDGPGVERGIVLSDEISEGVLHMRIDRGDAQFVEEMQGVAGAEHGRGGEADVGLEAVKAAVGVLKAGELGEGGRGRGVFEMESEERALERPGLMEECGGAGEGFGGELRRGHGGGVGRCAGMREGGKSEKEQDDAGDDRMARARADHESVAAKSAKVG